MRSGTVAVESGHVVQTSPFLAFAFTQALALDPAQLAAIHPAMEAAVQAKQAAGIVTLVMEKAKSSITTPRAWRTSPKVGRWRRTPCFGSPR